MPKAVKWLLIVAGGVIVLLVLAMVIVPLVVNLNSYKPEIEAKVTEITGRSFKIGGEIKPSVFPWIGVGLSDLHFGNPPEFKEKDMISVGSFEVRIKLLPLLSRHLEIKRFVIKNPRINLGKDKSGHANWEGLGGSSAAPASQSQPKPAPQPESGGGLPIESLKADEFAIDNGQIQWVDQLSGSRHEVKDINLNLTDVSFDKPIQVAFRAVVENQPIALDGSVGPLGKEPGQSPVNVNLVSELLAIIKINIKGRIDHPAHAPSMDLNMEMASFSPRKLLAALKQPLPFAPADAQVLNKMALSCKLSGTADHISIDQGKLALDDSRLQFSAQAKDLGKPDVKFNAELDHIDLDRYLPPPPPEEEAAKQKKAPAGSPTAKTDYAPLRKLILDGHIQVGELKVKNARMQKIDIRATARNGVVRLDPLTMDLYNGHLAATSVLDVQKERPQSTLKLNLSSVQAGPMLKDFLKKEYLQGLLNAAIQLQFSGDQPDVIRKTLDGKGDLKFTDGAIIGIDLANMVRNVGSAFGLAEASAEKPRTDFSELLLPFSVTDGVARIDGTRLTSPLLRVTAAGKADLAREVLDLRVEPKFVATLVGQGDTKAQRSGVQVPVLISGTFNKPKFEPDLKAMLTRELQDKGNLQKILPGEEKVKEDLGKKAEELFKGLLKPKK